jgi:hypothetical protein
MFQSPSPKSLREAMIRLLYAGLGRLSNSILGNLVLAFFRTEKISLVEVIETYRSEGPSA